MAGKQRTYDKTTRERVEKLLDELPEKPKSERALTTRELVAELKSKIRAAQAKGYTLEEIAQHFQQAGATISVSTIKSALKGGSSARRQKSTTPASESAQHSEG